MKINFKRLFEKTVFSSMNKHIVLKEAVDKGTGTREILLYWITFKGKVE